MGRPDSPGHTPAIASSQQCGIIIPQSLNQSWCKTCARRYWSLHVSPEVISWILLLSHPVR